MTSQPEPADEGLPPLAASDPRALGPYRLLGRLGAGGMGQVFLGRSSRGQLAAVKMVHEGYAHDERFRARFVREIEVARQVDGPWTAAVIDADPEAARPWMATEYVAGPTLESARTSGAIPASSLPLFCVRLSEALASLHSQGVVHRDLKPSNVILGPDGPRLIDFGIARAVDATSITHTGAVVGPPRFMSPEQANGHEAGPASDVFSLAGVLVFAVTARAPFGDVGAPAVVLLRILSREPDLDGLSSPLRAVLRRCLEKDPDRRPSAAAVAEALGGLAEDDFAPCEPAPSRPPTPPAPTADRTARWLWIGGTATTIMVIVVLAAVVLVMPGGSTSATPPATAGPLLPPLRQPAGLRTVAVARTVVDQHVVVDTDGRAYVTVADGVQAVDPGDSSGGGVLDLRITPSDLALDRAEHVLYAARRDDTGGRLEAVDARALRPAWSAAVPGSPRAVAVDPVRSLVYVAQARDELAGGAPALVVVDTRRQAVVGSVPLPGDPTALVVRADGPGVTVATDSAIVVVDPVSRRVVSSSPTSAGDVLDHLRTGDGTDRIYGVVSRGVEVFDGRTSRRVGKLTVPRSAPALLTEDAVPSATGRHLFVIQGHAEVLVLDTETTFPVARLALPPTGSAGDPEATLAADGKTLFVADNDGPSASLHTLDVSEFE